MEKNAADFDGQRIHKMEKNMERINTELAEIKRLVSAKENKHHLKRDVIYLHIDNLKISGLMLKN